MGGQKVPKHKVLIHVGLDPHQDPHRDPHQNLPIAISAFTFLNRPFLGCELDVPRLATPRGRARGRAREHAVSESSPVRYGDLSTIAAPSVTSAVF